MDQSTREIDVIDIPDWFQKMIMSAIRHPYPPKDISLDDYADRIVLAYKRYIENEKGGKCSCDFLGKWDAPLGRFRFWKEYYPICPYHQNIKQTI